MLKKILYLTLLCFCTFALFAPNNISIAKTPSLSDLEKQRENNYNKLNELSNQLQDVKKGLKNTYIDLEKTKGELEITNTKYAIALADYNTTKREYDDINKRLTYSKQFQSDVTNEIKVNNENFANAKKQLSILGRNMLMTGGVDNTISLLIGAKNADEAKKSYLVYQSVKMHNKNVVNKYVLTQGYALNNEARLKEVNTIIAELNEKAKKTFKKANAVKTKVGNIKASLDKLNAQLKSKATNLESKKAVYIKEQKAIESKQKVLNAQIAKITDDYDYGNGAWGRPLSSIRVSQAWGWRTHPIWGYRSFHTGVDLSASCGTPIYSTGNGTVQSVSTDNIWGKRTVISHGKVNGKSFVSTYNHQSSISVSKGARVSRGQRIGKVGTTGWSTGCHLHFEIYVGGTSVNPMNYI